ncbi:winged helix-turn-helix domain-containing protein [Pseudolysobacter antarcticus]|nr:winged helix-turn-helix domain-containing protein [Pseudolysobacter antarcticus]
MIYRFDDFQLNSATRELHRHDILVALPARAFECLAYLIEHRERAVGRDELIAAVWGRVEVSDALLSHTVVKIRRSLGDTGNEQRTIRTVPRFGYRWVGEIVALAASVETSPPIVAAAPPMDAVPADIAAAAAPGIEMPSMPSAISPRKIPQRITLVLAAFASIALVVVLLWFLLATNRRDVAAVASNTAAANTENSAALALVLPAEVSASDDWRWLRFGLMDLVANRLRDGALYTMPSESVVALLKQRDVANKTDLLHDTQLAKVAAMRILPRVRSDGARWTVRLDVFGAQNDQSVEAQADDAIKAARDAADLLLNKLGHKLNIATSEPTTPQLEELMQRSGAAMLADQLDQARDLIRAATPELQHQPRVEQRMAQIEFRSGNYVATESRLHVLLDRLSPQRDAALRARALITLAGAYLRQNKIDLASDTYEEAITLRQGQSDPVVLGVAYLGRGSVLAQKQRFDEAISELSRARTELEATGDGQGVAAVDVNLGEIQSMRHRPAEALPLLKNAVREFELLGLREGLAYALGQQASAEREMLDFAAAQATTTRFWPAEQHTNNLRLRWTLTCVRAEALTDSGQHDEALLLLSRIRNEADPHADSLARACADALAANIAWRHGDAVAAARFAEAALSSDFRDAEPTRYLRTAVLRTHVLLHNGQAADAAALLQTLRTWIGSNAAGDWRAIYLQLLDAEQDAAAHRTEAALEQFAAALQSAIRFNVAEDLVAVAVPYLQALIAASQLDSARIVAGRISVWADRDLRVATAQAQLFRALGQSDAARKAEETAARLLGPQTAAMSATPPR